MMDRNEAIELIMGRVGPEDLVLSTTGMISREVFYSTDRPSNFYMIGSMGLLAPFGLGLAKLSPGQRVYILDGDGSALMGMGTMALIAHENPPNLVHIILDNESYESTGGQPSISSNVPLDQIAASCGYKTSTRVDGIESLDAALSDLQAGPGPHMVLVKVGIAPVDGIPRVSHSPEEIRDRFKDSVLGSS
jgi:thiamine pyrophosphate-dependent acetolactate synthase large subunit-like protein